MVEPGFFSLSKPKLYKEREKQVFPLEHIAFHASTRLRVRLLNSEDGVYGWVAACAQARRIWRLQPKTATETLGTETLQDPLVCLHKKSQCQKHTL